MTSDIQFVVRESTKHKIDVLWLIKDVTTVTDFLYWVFEHRARYQLRVRSERPLILELVPEYGTVGEYTHGLWWDYEHETVYRRFETGLHYATQHAFDGMPKQVFDALDRDAQIIRVESAHGLFALSLNEWWDYCFSGRNDRAIFALGIKSPGRQT